MLKIICLVGARPNFMKAAPVIEALQTYPQTTVVLVHTGQHYDRAMSDLFFIELGLPKPDVDLQVGSCSHGEQTGQIMIRLEPILKHEKPDLVMVFGDVNSTVAGALCAAKLGIPVAHVEAGLRSFDRTMPEELNRIVTDQLSDYLFTTEPSAQKNLLKEGIAHEKIFFVGNVMVDTLVKCQKLAPATKLKEKLGLISGGYGLLTLHRPSNVDQGEVLGEILSAVTQLAKTIPIIFPCHPRTRQQLLKFGYQGLDFVSPTNQDGEWAKLEEPGLILLDAIGYMDFLALMSDARMVFTDSGGIQEETTVLGVPCLTLRENTERPITIEQGTNVLVGNSRERILAAATKVINGGKVTGRVPDLWDGKAAERIAEIIEHNLAPPVHHSRESGNPSCHPDKIPSR